MINNSSAEFLSASYSAWSLIFLALSSTAILIGIVMALVELRNARRLRTDNYLREMHHIWQRKKFKEAWSMLERANTPICGELGVRICRWEKGLDELSEDQVDIYRKNLVTVINGMNDIGTYLEKSVDAQKEFFGQTHNKFIQIVHVVEPFFIGVSAAQNTRWGIRLLRLRRGAIAFHRSSAHQRTKDISFGNVVIVSGEIEKWPWYHKIYTKMELCFRKNVLRRGYIETIRKAKKNDDTAIACGEEVFKSLWQCDESKRNVIKDLFRY